MYFLQFNEEREDELVSIVNYVSDDDLIFFIPGGKQFPNFSNVEKQIQATSL
jgi:hypothetical protein